MHPGLKLPCAISGMLVMFHKYLASPFSVLVWKGRLKSGSGGSHVVAWSSYKVLRNLGLLAKVADSFNSAAVPSHSKKEKRAECSEAITKAKLKALPFQLSIPDRPHSNNPIPGMCMASPIFLLIVIYIFFCLYSFHKNSQVIGSSYA